ncbi:hypothetical protein C2E23DRAFT_891051 [Lenzites betulinus]|nr:hypothetical protein C2E23DRAFT_891051 [Lenzites betulinus]
MSAPQLTIVLHAPTSPTPASPGTFHGFGFVAACGSPSSPVLACPGSPVAVAGAPSWPAVALPADQYLPMPAQSFFAPRPQTIRGRSASRAPAKTKPGVVKPVKVPARRSRRLPDPWVPTLDAVTGSLVLVPARNYDDPAPTPSISAVLAEVAKTPQVSALILAPALAAAAVAIRIAPAPRSKLVGFKDPALIPTLEWIFVGLMAVVQISLVIF